MEGQRKGKGGGGGGRGSGGGKQSSAHDFIGFHYERPSVNAPPSSTPKRTKRTPVVVATKEESVHASFRFIVSALANPLEPALYDPDCVLPWEMVECVVVPLNQEHTLLCPICLDTVHAPRITKCGHTFCITCLLRHMQSDRSNAQKCPMCMEYICRSDLRSVMFMYDHWDAEDTAMAAAQATGGGTGGGGGCEDAGLLHPFYVFQPYRGQLTVNCLAAKGVDAVTGGGTATTTATATTATATATAAASSSALQVQQPHAFHHLIVEKGNCRPYLPQKLLRFVLDHPNAAAAAATTTTVVGHRGGPSSSRRSTSSSSSTVSNSVGGSLAEHLTSLQRVLPNEVGDEEARYARLMYRPWAVSCARWQEEEHLLRTWQTELYREHDLDSAACLVQALEMVQQTRDERTKFLQSHFLVDVPDLFSPPSTRPTSSPAPVYEGSSSGIAPVTTASLPSLLDNDALYQHLYQSIHGDAVYLHPLCQRALQAEYEQQRGSGGWPPVVTGRVVDVEYVRLGASARDKPAYLRHLPAYSAVSIVELDMKKLVSREIYEQFASEFARRQQKRREKKKQEQRHERHVAQKYRQREAQQQQQYQQYSGDDLYFDDFAYSQHFPTAATATAQAAAVSDDADIAAIEAAFAALAASSEGNSGLPPPPPPPSIAASSPPVARFAEITQMHGHFPSLGGSSGSSGASVVREGSAESTAGSGSSGSSATGAGGAPKAPTATRGRSGGVGATASAAAATSTGARTAASLAPASSLSLVANRKPTSSAASVSSSLSSSLGTAAGSKSLIRSAVLASSSSSSTTTTSAATGGVSFTLEDALKNSRGKVQKKGAKKTSTPVTVSVSGGSNNR
eukprot:gene10196-7271_t